MANLWTELKYWRSRAETSERVCRALEAEVVKLQERVSMLVSNCDALTEAIRKVEEWRDYWKKGYFEVYAELQDQAKALSEANEKLNGLVEVKKPKTYDPYRAMYWQNVGALAARRDTCQDLVKENKELKAVNKSLSEGRGLVGTSDEDIEALKAKIKRLEEEAVVARGGYDYLVEEKKDLEGIVATLRELRDFDWAASEELKKKLKDLEDHYQEYFVKTEGKLETAAIDQHQCHITLAELRKQKEGLKKDRNDKAVYWFKKCQEARDVLDLHGLPWN